MTSKKYRILCFQTRTTAIGSDFAVFGRLVVDVRSGVEQTVASVQRRRFGRTRHRHGARITLHRRRSSHPDRPDHAVSRSM